MPAPDPASTGPEIRPRRDAAARGLILLLALLVLFAVRLADPFGVSSAGAAQSRAIIKRVLAPWWGASGALLATVDTAVVVVLEQREDDAPWPPARREVRDALAALAGACPAVIAVDVLFIADRPGVRPGDMFDAVARAGARCPRPPAIILADKRIAGPGDGQREDVFDFVGPPCRLLRELDGVDCAKRPVRAFGTIEWRGIDLDRDSPWYGLTNEAGVYRLLAAPQREAAGGARGDATDGATDGATDAAADGAPGGAAQAGPPGRAQGGGAARPSLALAAWGALCARLSPRLDPSICPAAPLDAALARHWGPEGGGILAGMPAGAEDGGEEDASLAALRRAAAAPMDLTWPRWAPREADIFSPPVEAETKALRACVPEDAPGLATRLGESLSLALEAAPGGDPDRSDRAAVRCFPLLTIAANLLRGPAPGVAPPTDALSERQRSPAEGWTAQVAGRAAFYGFSDPYGGDMVESPVHGALPGVFAHAVALENLLRDGIEGYTRLPPRNLFRIGPAPVGAEALVELALTAVLAAAALLLRGTDRVRSRLDRAEEWRRDVFRAIAAKAGRPAAILVHVGLGWTARLLAAGALLLVSAVLTVAVWSPFHASLASWINVGVLAGLAAALVERAAAALPCHAGSSERGSSDRELAPNAAPSVPDAGAPDS